MVGKTISHYEIQEKLGEGGMGVVYKARDTRLGRIVALKFLPADAVADASLRRRLLHEAQAAAALDHANICTVHEIDEWEGEIFLAMAYVDGPSLEKKIEQRPLKLEEALDIALQIGEGLELAHERGVTHRDIKSSNILLTSRGQVKIADFGLAVLGNRTRLTQAGTIVGSPGYMSPEQAQGEPADARSDIWSLGVVLYEMVSGQLPFRGETAQAQISTILHKEPEPLTALRSGVPVEVDRIVGKALAKNPGERYQHMADMLVDLRAVRNLLESRSRAAQVAPAGRVKGARIPLWAAVLVLVVAAAGAGLAWWWSLRGKAPPPEQKMVRLTFDSGRTTGVTASRDGRLMAYSSDRSGEENLDIWVQWVDPAAGRQPTRLTNHPANDYFPSLSPDGSRVVFRSNRDGGGIYMLDSLAGEPAGGKARKLVDRGWYPRFSPDGKWISCVQYSPSGATATNKMYLIPAEGGAPQVFQPEFGVDPPPSSFGPVWSPDGQYLLFLGAGSGSRRATDWWVAPVDGGQAVRAEWREAIPATGLVQPPMLWVPGRVMFMRGSTVEGYNLFSVPIEDGTWRLGGPVTQITSGPGTKIPGALLAGGQLLFENSTGVSQVAVTSFNVDTATVTGAARQLTRDASVKFRLSTNSDGSRVAYTSYGGLETPRSEIRIMTVKSGAEAAVPLRAALVGTALHFSPDGSILAYRDNVGQKPVSYVVAQEGSTPRQICEDCSVAGVFPGGKLFLMQEKGTWVRLEPDSARRTPVFSPPSGSRVRDVHLSDDGRWLAVLLDQPSGENVVYMLPLGTLPVAAGDWIPAVADSAWVSCPRIAPGGKWLLYFSDRDGDVSVWAQRFDPEARKAVGRPHAVLDQRSNLLWVMTPRFNVFLGVARDKLLVPMIQATGNIWMTRTDLR